MNGKHTQNENKERWKTTEPNERWLSVERMNNNNINNSNDNEKLFVFCTQFKLIQMEKFHQTCKAPTSNTFFMTICHRVTNYKLIANELRTHKDKHLFKSAFRKRPFHTQWNRWNKSMIRFDNYKRRNRKIDIEKHTLQTNEFQIVISMVESITGNHSNSRLGTRLITLSTHSKI